MTTQFIEQAQRAVELPEVQEMMHRLALYNLGVFVPHMHAPDGGFAPPPKDTVQIENNLAVSFVREDDQLCKGQLSSVGVGMKKQKLFFDVHAM